jgi:hypothetical protein
MPVVYILTNESMPETIKIGITENLERRIRELDNTSTPLPFECFYAVEVQDAQTIERKIHQGLDEYRVRPNREFFYCAPELAKSILEIAEVMGGNNVTPTSVIVESSQDAEALEKAHKTREQFNFGMLGIDAGETLTFKNDHSITATVVDEKKIKWNGEVTSLSASALSILQSMGKDWDKVAGPRYWCYQGETLSDIRNRVENK